MRKRTNMLVLIVLMLAGAALAAAPVAIEGIYPESGVPGSTIIVKGRGFTLGNTRLVWSPNIHKGSCPGFVEFNGARGEVVLWQDNLVVVKVPEHATSGPVRLTLTSGITVQGNHFEVMSANESDQVARRDYAFEEKEGMGWGDYLAFNKGLYPSPWYFYNGYQPRYRSGRGWNIPTGAHQDGFLDFFLVSGPLLSSCFLNTGFDDVMFFPSGFMRDFNTRWGWWDNAVRDPGRHRGQKSRKRYSFEEK